MALFEPVDDAIVLVESIVLVVVVIETREDRDGDWSRRWQFKSRRASGGGGSIPDMAIRHGWRVMIEEFGCEGSGW